MEIQTFIKLHKYHFLAMVIFLITAATSGYVVFNGSEGARGTEQTKLNATVDKVRQGEIAVTGTGKIEVLSVASPAGDRFANTEEKMVSEDRVEAGGGAELAVNPDLSAENIATTETTTADESIYKSDDNFISATLLVAGNNHITKIAPNSSVYDLMQRLREDKVISFSGREYSGMGFFVEEINGVKNDNLKGRYWIYYINGESAKLGVSNYIVQNNDLIEWKYGNTN